jgi:hypothetical protein
LSGAHKRRFIKSLLASDCNSKELVFCKLLLFYGGFVYANTFNGVYKNAQGHGYVGFMAGLRCFLGKRLLWQEMSGIVRLNRQDALLDCQALLKNKEVLK